MYLPQQSARDVKVDAGINPKLSSFVRGTGMMVSFPTSSTRFPHLALTAGRDVLASDQVLRRGSAGAVMRQVPNHWMNGYVR